MVVSPPPPPLTEALLFNIHLLLLSGRDALLPLPLFGSNALCNFRAGVPRVSFCCYLALGLRNPHGARNMAQVADRVVERVMLSLPTSGGVGQDTGTPRQVGSIDMDNVTKAVEWWAGKAEQTDKELHHVGRQGVR